jgi:hypothetical protein
MPDPTKKVIQIIISCREHISCRSSSSHKMPTELPALFSLLGVQIIHILQHVVKIETCTFSTSKTMTILTVSMTSLKTWEEVERDWATKSRACDSN